MQTRSAVAVAVGMLALVALPAAQAIEPGQWFGRIGASYVDPNSDSGGLEADPSVEVRVDESPGFTFTLGYMMSDHFALELLAAAPISHDLEGAGSIRGVGDIGEVKHLPPTFSVQYHFTPRSSIRPYVGVGVNYTIFVDDDVKRPLRGASLDLDDSVGFAAQAGIDFDVGSDWFVNTDVRWINIETEAELGTPNRGPFAGVRLGTIDVDINPLIYTFSIGRVF